MPGKPLSKKLGIKFGMTLSFIDAPEDLRLLLGDLPSQILVEKIEKQSMLDYIHGFYTLEKDLLRDIYFLKEHLKKNGMIWISWPKGSSGVMTDLNREKIRELVLKVGLVDVKVCAVNDIWSALKFVFRKKDRI